MLYEKYSKLELITPSALHSTVMCDERTCLWYTKLFSLRQVIERLKGSSEGGALYRRYRTYSLMVVLLLAISLCSGVAGVFILKGSFLILTVASAVFAGSAVFFMLKVRRDLAELAVCLFEMDRSRTPPGTTLFQLGEIYAQKYGGPSLVSVIWSWDQCFRDGFLLVFMLAFGVYFLSSWKTGLCLMVGCFLMAWLVKALVLWRKSA
jgi:hypothetical protein